MYVKVIKPKEDKFGNIAEPHDTEMRKSVMAGWQLKSAA
jgi:hypothetical protein